MLEELKKEVCEANLLLPKHGLITFTWGRRVRRGPGRKGLMVIKPSGVEYDGMCPEDMVGGEPGHRRAGGGQVQALQRHRHPPGSVQGVPCPGGAWSTPTAAGPPPSPRRARGSPPSAPPRGTTSTGDSLHPADDPGGDRGRYELETGKVIIETSAGGTSTRLQVPAVLVHSHGPFTWGTDPHNAVHNALVLEELASSWPSTPWP